MIRRCGCLCIYACVYVNICMCSFLDPSYGTSACFGGSGQAVFLDHEGSEDGRFSSGSDLCLDATTICRIWLHRGSVFPFMFPNSTHTDKTLTQVGPFFSIAFAHVECIWYAGGHHCGGIAFCRQHLVQPKQPIATCGGRSSPSASLRPTW